MVVTETAPAGAAPHTPSTVGNPWRSPGNLRHTATPTGGVGLLRVASSDLGRRGLLRLSLAGDLASNDDFPVQGADNSRTAGTFALSFVPLDFLEVSLAYTASANTNTRSSPNLIQAFGDVTVGARATKQWLPGLWAGADVRVMTFSGVGSQSQVAFGFSPRAVATYDASGVLPLPLRAHANLGLLVDGTGSLVDASRLNAAEEYALGINRYPRLSVVFGVEAPLPLATPFIEYGLASPLGVEGGQLVAPDGTLVPAGSVAPQTLGLGVKVTALPNFTFTAAAELGLTRQVGRGVTPVPPFNLLLAASLNVDPLVQAGGPAPVAPVARETVRVASIPSPSPAPIQPAAVAQTSQVSGVVLDAKTRQPLSGVLVAVVDSMLPPVASDPRDGRFLTYALPAGTVKLSVHKDGYVTLVREVVLKAGEPATVELALVPEVKPALLALAVTSKRKPVAATLAFEGPERRQVSLSQGDAASQKLQLSAGRYVVEVTAPGFLAQTRGVQVTDGTTLDLAFDLEPEPKQWLVKRDNGKLELTQPLRFVDGKAELLPDSQPVLAQVVDLVVRTGIKRLRIEGHTDNQGDKAANLALSKERARAVAEALVKAGLEPARLESEGFGDTRPVAPNLTPRGRELNRRVEFVLPEP